MGRRARSAFFFVATFINFFDLLSPFSPLLLSLLENHPTGYPGAGPAGAGAYNPYGYPPTAAYGYGRGPEGERESFCFCFFLFRPPPPSFALTFFPVSLFLSRSPPSPNSKLSSAYGPGAYPGAVPAAPGKPGAPGVAMPPQAPAGGFGGGAGAGFDLEAQQAANFAAGFAEQQVRSRFVGKVLSIVFLQLLCTVGMSVLFYYVSPLKLYVRQNAWPFYLSWALSFGMLIAMSCSETLRRKYPTNVLFLGAFTAVFSFQIAAVTSYFDTQAVMIAFIATTAVVLGCAFIAFFTKLDMTKYGGWLAIAGLSFMVVAMIAAFWPWGGKIEEERKRGGG